MLGDASVRTRKLVGTLVRVVRVHGGLHPRFRPQLLVQETVVTWRDLGPTKQTLWEAQSFAMVELAKRALEQMAEI
jgi:hypothetical protein